jgi:hypothetical protein
MTWRDDNGCPTVVIVGSVLLAASQMCQRDWPVNFGGAQDASG